MASFSDRLKAATQTQNYGIATAAEAPMVSEPSIMTLSTESDIVSYADETWTLSGRYKTTDNNALGKRYEDENISYVDDKKNVKINEYQINLTQEENSQYIPFEMFRYYDGIDLTDSSMKITIYFENKNGDFGESDVINVRYSSTKIRFGFLVPKEATIIAGKLKFEIHVTGSNPLGGKYLLKTKPNDELVILESLQGNGNIIVDETWATNVLEEVKQAAEDAQYYSAQAQSHANQARQYLDSASTVAEEKVNEVLENYATITYVDEAIAGVDVSEQLKDLATKEELQTAIESVDVTDQLIEYAKTSDVDEKLENYDTSEQTTQKISTALENYATKDDVSDAISSADLDSYYKKTETYSNTEIDEKIANVEVDLTGYATESYVDGKTATLNNDINSNKENISTLSNVVGALQEEVGQIDKTPGYTYDIVYNDTENPEIGENGFGLYQITNEGKENEVRELKKKFTIAGGSGGGTSSVLKIAYVTTSPVITTVNDKVLITYNFSGTDSSGDDIPEGNYTWKIGSKIIASGVATNGDNTFDATSFATTTSQKFTLSITDEGGSLVTKSWTVQQVDVRLESTFSDTYQYNGDVSFNFTPYGAIQKDIHFILDGEEIGTINTSTSGIPMSYTIPSQPYGSHLLDVYMTTTVNNTLITSNHVYKDILWIDSTASIPVIGCATPTINTTQYNSINIKYVVIDPKTETPKVTWYLGEEIVSVETLTEKDSLGYYTFTYKANESGTFVFTITCGEAEPKTITVNVEELDIDITPVTAGLVFDFNPVGYSNSSSDRLWSNNGISMTVSENFDWINGGYQIDENGDQYFCVKAGTSAVINYNLFADDPKKTGKEFKTIFRTKNIRKRNTSFLSCMDSNIGLDMKVEHATVYDTGGSLKANYCEDTIIEYEFNINKDTDMMIVMSYEDGTPGKPYEYTATSSFKQPSPQPITIGSDDCDVHIYRMKAYSLSLTDTDVKNNFIADARNADEMIARYTRNQIYNEDGKVVSTSANGDFSAAALMKAAPHLRYIFLEVPQFTNDKDNKIDGCTVYFRYPNGTRPQDNWTCTGMRHRGQGTSSNLYGYAGRNIDLCMDRSTSLFTWIDEEGRIVESSTITLTDSSIPTDYLNVKLNIASSELENNAQMARRFNEYQPFLRYARKKDNRVKDTMEFYDCVVFIRETSTDPSVPHREFKDTNWHFYGCGNVGDSKKTDDSRVNDKNDPKEHVVEIMDADVDLAKFPTGKEGNVVCPVEEWTSGNTAYDILYSTNYVYDEDGEFESFGNESYEFRYEMDGITSEQREENINAWRNLYKFIATSTDEEFYAHLKDYFVVDSALYYYLFTERYTMVDNRAKNSFWHYGKVYISTEEATALGEAEASYYIIDDEAAAINDGYRYDLTFSYDFDTCLGIDNTGDYVFSYGKEDTDYYVDGDPTSDYIFRVADSVFFCRLRDLFPSEMQAMFKDREEKNAWSANSLIIQWDEAQSHFPEELWRLDYERKNYRTYLGLSIDNSINEGEGRGIDKTFLIGKFFGRKKYARRAYETNNEIYFATKYFGNKALSDVFWIRGNVPIGSSIKPNYSLTLVPYSDMYVCVKYGSTGTPIHKKVKAGQTCVFENNAERMDFIYVYAASYIQEVGDLSRCFVGDNNFTSAIRLQKLEIGSTDEGYENTFMTEVLVANNTLLEYLDIRNISGINTVINVSGCSNLKELYAEGTNATGVIFANGGLLRVAHLPKITSLSMKNLNYIEDFVVDGYDNLQTLIVENVPNINTYDIVNSSPTLRLARLINLNWDSTYQIEDASIFDRLLAMDGIDSSGYETDQSVLTGTANISVIKQQQALDYQTAWSDLEIISNSIIPQHKVTFMNTDGTELGHYYVIEGSTFQYDESDSTYKFINEEFSEEIIVDLSPTIPSTVSHDFTFDGWNITNFGVFEDVIVTATYTESLREYSIKYVSKGVVMQQSTGKYGEYVPYTGTRPTYTAEESANKFSLFNRWDKSGFIDGEKTVNAIFDEIRRVPTDYNGKDLSDMTPVEIYALIKLKEKGALNIEDIIVDKDQYSFTIGNDIDYDDIESEVLISEPTYFVGTNHINTGIKLFDEDKDFVLAIDYEFSTESAANSVLAQCLHGDGNVGFKLFNNNNNIQFYVTGASNTVLPSDKRQNREMLVIRHKKGESHFTIYKSNLDGSYSLSEELIPTKTFSCDSPLVFGGASDDGNSFKNHAIGNINWAKIWYRDFGDTVCKELAEWIHEPITMEACGFGRYYLSDGSGSACSFTMVASHLLSKPKKWNLTSSNTGGWEQSYLNTFLNTRLYKAMPHQIRALMKQVKVYSSIGDNSNDTTFSNCYIAVPSLIEVDSSKTSEPYYSEGTTISFFNGQLVNGEVPSRKRAFLNGGYSGYWLRSPNVHNNTKYYVYRVDEKGVTQGITTPYTDLGVLIMISL